MKFELIKGRPGIIYCEHNSKSKALDIAMDFAEYIKDKIKIISFENDKCSTNDNFFCTVYVFALEYWEYDY